MTLYLTGLSDHQLMGSTAVVWPAVPIQDGHTTSVYPYISVSCPHFNQSRVIPPDAIFMLHPNYLKGHQQVYTCPFDDNVNGIICDEGLFYSSNAHFSKRFPVSLGQFPMMRACVYKRSLSRFDFRQFPLCPNLIRITAEVPSMLESKSDRHPRSLYALA